MLLYRLFLVFDSLIMSLPRNWRKKLFTTLAELVHRVAAKRNRVIQQNLDFMFHNQLTDHQKHEAERYCYRNLALNLLQSMENRRNSTEDLARHVSFINKEAVDTILSEGRGIIFVSAHFGNWELGATALSALITPVSSIYKEFDRTEFNSYLMEVRQRHRMKLFEKNGALKSLARTLKNGGSVSLMIDQASNAKHGVEVTFFGHKTYQTSTPAILAHKYNAAIVPLYIFSNDEERFTIEFETPIEVKNDDPSSILEATQRQADSLEKTIRAYPKFWFWCHKRWKSEYKEIYAS